METTGNNKTSSPTFIKKTPAGRYTAQKSETKGKYQTLKNIVGHRDYFSEKRRLVGFYCNAPQFWSMYVCMRRGAT